MKTTFGEFLAIKRKEKGLTQRELAEMLFVSESTVGKWEQNRSNPDITVLPVLSEILGVSEHELITASIDSVQRENSIKAKKWSRLSFGWNLFFYISYSVALLVCFIVNLATEGRLSWFFIVLSALALSATFTTLPQFVTRVRLLGLSLAPLLALLILFGVTCLYTGGNWFFVASSSTVAGFLFVFTPIYLRCLSVPPAVRKYAPFFSLAVGVAALLFMLAIIENFTAGAWLGPLALPLVLAAAGVAALVMLVAGYLPIGRSFKAGAILGIFAAVCYPYLFLVEGLVTLHTGIPGQTDYLPNLTVWTGDYINSNVWFLTVSVLVFLSFVFLTVGLIKIATREHTVKKSAR